MLVSPRVVTDQNANVVSRRDFMPFGEDLTRANYGSDAIRQKFTGYQKDNETGLDFAEARYYNNVFGRFTAVDPLLASGKSANPQTFNRYAYALNSPLMMSDPSGMQAGKWYVPITKSGEIDSTRSYEYINNGASTKGYRQVTETNRAGQLIGSYSGAANVDGYSDYVIRFNPNGPREPQPLVDVNTGRKSYEKLSDFDRNGLEIIRSDDYSLVHPDTGAVYNAIEPYDVALSLTPIRGLSSDHL